MGLPGTAVWNDNLSKEELEMETYYDPADLAKFSEIGDTRDINPVHAGIEFQVRFVGQHAKAFD